MSDNHLPAIPEIAFASPQLLLAEVLEKLAALEEENRQKDQRITALEDEVTALRTDHEKAIKAVWVDIVDHEEALAKLETPALRQETAGDHIDRLFSEMRRLDLRQVRMKDAARILGLSVPQMKNVKPHIGDDPRFVIAKDPHHKQRHLIRLI